jgi:hypothetical protein
MSINGTAIPKTPNTFAAVLPYCISGPFHEPGSSREPLPQPHQEKESADDACHQHGQPFAPVVRDSQCPADSGQQEESHDQKPSKGSDRVVSGRTGVVVEGDDGRTGRNQHRYGYLAKSHGYFKSRV